MFSNCVTLLYITLTVYLENNRITEERTAKQSMMKSLSNFSCVCQLCYMEVNQSHVINHM